MPVKKVAVIGTGGVNSGIAAHIANAGIDVEFISYTPEGANEAIVRMLDEKSLTLMYERNVKKIRAGYIEENIDRLKDCDFIIEDVSLDKDTKFNILKKIDGHRKEGSIVASNTSSFLLEELIENQSDELKKDFFITHFLDHPRYMQLLEFVTSEYNNEDQIIVATEFLDKTLGKRVINCKDKPELLVNRLGVFWLQCAINEAHNLKLKIEEVDALLSQPLGMPTTGIFTFIDLLGFEAVFPVSKILSDKLPNVDAYYNVYKNYPVIEKMIESGFTGLSSKGGFYRKNENQKYLAIDLETGETRERIKPELDAIDNFQKGGIKALLSTDDKYGEYVWKVLMQFISYAAEHAYHLTDNITLIDDAMKLSYGWKLGPFELLDKIGVDYFIERIKKEGGVVSGFIQKAAGQSFYRVNKDVIQFLNQTGEYEDIKRPQGVLLLSDIKLKSEPVIKNSWLANKLNMGANVWDIGDGVLCIEFCSKLNSLDYFNLKTIINTCNLVERSKGLYKAIVIHNESSVFSAGANVRLMLYAANLGQYWLIKKFIKLGQDALMRIKYAKVPVVSAPSGKALGGGCEVLMHSHHVQAHAETYTGLVEIGVGLIPAFGGTSEMLIRMIEAQKQGKIAGGPMPPIIQAFENISTATVATSAFEAKDLMFLKEEDGITMNKYRLLADAKEQALKMVEDFIPKEPVDVAMVGMSGMAAFRIITDIIYLRGLITSYDVIVFDKIAEVLTGGKKAENKSSFSEIELRELELENVMFLLNQERTLIRMDHILRKNRPLREVFVKDKTAAEIRAEVDNLS